jgi:hypothetical protein
MGFYRVIAYRVIAAVSLVILVKGDLIPLNLLRQKVEEVSGQWRKKATYAPLGMISDLQTVERLLTSCFIFHSRSN